MSNLSVGDSDESQEEMKRPCDVFDMIGGSGTGGLIAIFLVVFKMTAKRALEEFTRFVDDYEAVALDPEERTERLRRTIQEILGKYGMDEDAKLVPTSEALPSCKLMVPVLHKNEVRVSCLLTNYVAGGEQPPNITIADAMLATCSFDPALLPTAIQQGTFAAEYIIGDLGLGNPIREVIAEACRVFGDEATVNCFLSAGHAGGPKISPPDLPPLVSVYVKRNAETAFVKNALFNADGSLKGGSKKVVVTGIGGCGKSYLIRKFVESFGDRFATVFLIDGSSKPSIRRDFVRNVRSLGAAYSQSSFKDSMSMLSHSPCNGQRLVIIDNVDDRGLDLTPFLPRWRDGAIIVTSRNPERGRMNPMGHLQLDVMSLDESIELILRGTGQPWPPSDSDEQTAAALANEMGCHPIALAQATSYMSLTGVSAETYVSQLNRHRTRMLDDPATSQVDMRYQTAFAAFDASYDIMPSDAQNFFRLLPFFHWRMFPLGLVELGAVDSFSADYYDYLARGDEFECGRQYLERTFSSSEGLELPKLDAMVASLRNHSLVTVIPAGDKTLLQMHPLIHEWGRLRIPNGDHGRLQAGAVRLLCCGAVESNYSMMRITSKSS